MMMSNSARNEAASLTMQAVGLLMAAVDSIEPSPLNPRRIYDEAAVAELAESISAEGILEPLVVRPWRPPKVDLARAGRGLRIMSSAHDATANRERAVRILVDAMSRPEGDTLLVPHTPAEWECMREAYRSIALERGLLAEMGDLQSRPDAPTSAVLRVRRQPKYELIAGERRWRAARLAGLKSVPVLVRADVEEDGHALRLMLAENLQRQDLDPIEQAEGYSRLQDLGMRQTEIAAMVHRSQPAVANAMRLLELPQEVRELIRKGDGDGGLSVSHGVALASFRAFPELVSKLAELAVKMRWRSRDLEDGAVLSDWILQETGLLRRLDFNARFDRATCRIACPHAAYRQTKVGGEYCLEPGHFDELARAASESRLAAARAVAEDLQAQGKATPKLADLALGSYHRFDSRPRTPAGCLEDCIHRSPALDRAGEIVTICLDVACMCKLEQKAAAGEKKIRADGQKALQSQLRQHLDAVDVIGVRELALIAADVLAGAPVAIIRDVYTHHAGITREEMPDIVSFDGRAATFRRLAALDPLRVMRVAVEVMLRQEIANAWERYGNRRAPRVEWYLGNGQQPVEGA